MIYKEKLAPIRQGDLISWRPGQLKRVSENCKEFLKSSKEFNKVLKSFKKVRKVLESFSELHMVSQSYRELQRVLKSLRENFYIYVVTVWKKFLFYEWSNKIYDF